MNGWFVWNCTYKTMSYPCSILLNFAKCSLDRCFYCPIVHLFWVRGVCWLGFYRRQGANQVIRWRVLNIRYNWTRDKLFHYKKFFYDPFLNWGTSNSDQVDWWADLFFFQTWLISQVRLDTHDLLNCTSSPQLGREADRCTVKKPIHHLLHFTYSFSLERWKKLPNYHCLI